MGAYTIPVDVRFNDLDGLGHVNNAIYLTYLEHCRMRFFTEEAGSRSERDFPFILAHAAIDYKAPIKMGAQPTVKMWTSRIGGKSWDFDYEVRNAATKAVYATARTVQVAYDYKAKATTPIPAALRTQLESIRSIESMQS